MNFAAKPIADTKTLEIERLRTDGGTQPRQELAESTIDSYVEALNDGAQFPPVVVFYDGHDYWLADGFHRVEAHRKAGRPSIAVEIHQGSQRDAILYSVGANSTHGLPRTNADKRRAVERLLRDDEWCQWSDRVIAEKCRVGHALVSRARKDIPAAAVSKRQLGESAEGSPSTYAMHESDEPSPANAMHKVPVPVQLRRGADGKVYNTANIGKKPQAAPVVPIAKPVPVPVEDDDSDDDEDMPGDAPLDGADDSIPIWDMTPDQRYEHALKLSERVKDLVSRQRKLHNDWQDLCKEWRNDEDLNCLMREAHGNQESTSKALAEALTALKSSVPADRCPKCNGSGEKDEAHACDVCMGSGWLNRMHLDQARGALRVAGGQS